MLFLANIITPTTSKPAPTTINKTQSALPNQQTTNCKKYGHTKNYCTKDPTCVKCAGKNSSSSFIINTISDRTSIKCALCSENTANYKGFTVKKALQIQKYPTLRKKIPVTETTHQTT